MSFEMDRAEMRWVRRGLLLMMVLVTVPLAARAGTVTYYYTNPQGTPLAEADSSGNITATFDYKPYGSPAMGVPATEPGYTGHVNDADTSLVYMQARYYDPSLGQFLNVDPNNPTPGDTSNFGRYAYAGDNPINNVDPDGRAFGIDDLAGVLVGGLVGVGVEAIKDVAVGHSMSWGDTAGAFTGGALMGEGIVNMPETGGASLIIASSARGAAVGLVSNSVQQGTDMATGAQKNYNVKSMAVSVGVGAVSGGLLSKVGTVRVAGITSGRGNMAAVAQAVKTRIANGNASNMSARTVAKGIAGSQVGDAGKTVVGGTIDGAKTRVCDHEGC